MKGYLVLIHICGFYIHHCMEPNNSLAVFLNGPSNISCSLSAVYNMSGACNVLSANYNHLDDVTVYMLEDFIKLIPS
jgi:hypothetical protein